MEEASRPSEEPKAAAAAAAASPAAAEESRAEAEAAVAASAAAVAEPLASAPLLYGQRSLLVPWRSKNQERAAHAARLRRGVHR